MTYSEAVAQLKALQSAGMQMGLERMQKTSAMLFHPERSYQTIHIAGTNGKGSTAKMIAAMLSANGYKVGLYTSPMITDICDMIQINGQPVAESVIAESISDVLNAVSEGLSEYECLTSAAFLCLKKEHVDIAVIECCLGGESDATNILPPPLCAVFTPIALDHTKILGSTINKIAACKSGIIKPSCDVVCSPLMNPEALGEIYEKASRTGSKVYLPTLPSVTNTSGNQFIYEDTLVNLQMVGTHQIENAITALQVMECLQHRGYCYNIPASIKALEEVTMPCRQEIISTDPFIMLDGAHNPHGIEALCNTVKQLQLNNITLIIGMLADKDTDLCAKILSPFFKRIICCTPPNSQRALPAKDLSTVFSKKHTAVTAIDDPIEAYLFTKKSNEPIVVAGSFYIASAVRRYILSKK